MVAELVRFIEVLVPSLENPEGNPIHGFVKPHVGAVKQAVAVVFIKFGGEAGNGRSFGITRGNVRIQIGG